MKTGRNDTCRCGSGKKYKKCCLAGDEAGRSQAPIEPFIPPLGATKIDNLISRLSEILRENRPDPRKSVLHDFAGLASSVEEEIDWLARDGDSDLDMVLGWWLAQCKTVEQRQIFEDRLARLRLEQPEAYFKQIPAFTALLRVINALEMQRGDVVRRVVEDGERLVQGDNEANAYGHLVRLLGWHGEMELMLRAIETASRGLPDANLLRCEERIYSQWLLAGRMLLTANTVQFESDVAGVPAGLWSEFMASQIIQGFLPSQALLQTAEVETLLWHVQRYQRRTPGGLPEQRDVVQYLLDTPHIQSLVLVSALPPWSRLLVQRGAKGPIPCWQDLLRDRLRDFYPVSVTARVREDAARLIEHLDADSSLEMAVPLYDT